MKIILGSKSPRRKALLSELGFSFETQLPFYIRADVTLSIPIVIYQRNFPDDIDINPILINMISDNRMQEYYLESD